LVVGLVVITCFVSLALLQAEVWVVDVVVVVVKPALAFGGFVTPVVAVVVPQSLVLAAWAAGENTTAAKVNANPSVFSMLSSYLVILCSVETVSGLAESHRPCWWSGWSWSPDSCRWRYCRRKSGWSLSST
jgi:hypothetical protein